VSGSTIVPPTNRAMDDKHEVENAQNGTYKWIGNLKKNCVLRHKEFIAHTRELKDGRWYLSIYQGNDCIYHTDLDPTKLKNGEQARRLAIAIIESNQGSWLSKRTKGNNPIRKNHIQYR
jgi:hypothetical protein